MTTAHPPLVADRYRLLKPLGQGGMGRVWKARDEVLRRDVAIKELVPPSNLTADERREMRERLLREARAIARLNHINVVRIFDVLRTDGDPWIVMEYVPSRSLQDVLAKEGPIDPVQAARIGLGVLSALRAAHRAGVMHRDVKPANVLLGENGRVVLTDFGLATVPGDPAVTRTGLVLGSPAYLAPERARTGQAGPEADMWSLGATLYAAVEGRSPYARPSAIATLAALATEPVPPAKNAGPLKPVLNGLLRKDPAARISAAEAERLLRRAAGKRTRGTRSLFDGVRRANVLTGSRAVIPAPRSPVENSGNSGASVSPPPIAVLVAPPPKRTLDLPAKTDAAGPGEPKTAGAGATGAATEHTAARAIGVSRAEAPKPAATAATQVASAAIPVAAGSGDQERTVVTAHLAHRLGALRGRLASVPRRVAASRARWADAARARLALARSRLARTWPGGSRPAGSLLARARLTWSRLVALSQQAAGPMLRGRHRRWLVAALAFLMLIVAAALVLPGRPERSEARQDSAATPLGGNAAPTAPTAASAAPSTPLAPSAKSSPPAATPAAEKSTGFVLPPGWQMYRDWTGFSVPIKQGWQVSRDSGGRVQFRDTQNGRMLMIDQTDTPQPDPVADWKSKEDYRRRTEPGYQRVGQIRAVDYGIKAADWEWLYTAPSGVRMHVRNRGFIAAKDKAYAIYWETPESIWTESLADFEVIAAGFRPVRGKAA